MKEDNSKLLDEEGNSQLANENKNFEEKHQELLKEIEEKKELMDKQLIDKEEAVGSIEVQMKDQVEQ